VKRTETPLFPSAKATIDASLARCLDDWSWENLHADDITTAVKLYMAQPHAVDQLGSTSTMSRMAILFSSQTGRPTSAATLFRELVALRKAGKLPSRPRKSTR